jgi:adenine-specific DNA glycosylase
VDGNVLRVFARLDNSSADITKPAAKREFTARVLEEMPKERPGPYNEALMELGALVCLPNGAPKCEVCPLAAQCKGRAAGRAEQLPVKTAKPEKTLVPVTAALITGPQGVLLQRRPSKGLLAGLWQPLAFEGTAMTQPELDAALRAIGLCVQWQAPLCVHPSHLADQRVLRHSRRPGAGGLRLGQPRGAERGIRGAKRICGHYAPVAAGIKSKQSGMAFGR